MAKTINYQLEADKAADRYKIPRHIFRALVGAESSWVVDAKSPVGATGLTQLMPKTAAGLGVDPLDPIQNLDGGARYLRQQIDRFGSIRLGLAAYNAGPGNVEKYGGVPPFKETQRYVAKITAAVPTEAQAQKVKPNKQQTVTRPLLSIPPPANLTDTSPLAGAGAADVAFENLGRIARGEDPSRSLAALVDSVAATPTPSRQSPAPVTPTPSPSPVNPETATRPAGKPPKAVPLKAGGGWGGSYGIAKGFADIAVGHGLTSTSEKRAKQKTTTGGVSDHFEGNELAYAFDLSNGVKTPEMDKAAVEIAARLGVKYDGKSPLVLTVRRNGYRIQVLYRTQVGGDHNDHIHLGVRKL
jgi:hypothetical protein